jgi:hypothetical protein
MACHMVRDVCSHRDRQGAIHKFPTEEDEMFRAIADVLRSIGSTLADIVTLPFRALARLFGGGSSSGRRAH